MKYNTPRRRPDAVAIPALALDAMGPSIEGRPTERMRDLKQTGFNDRISAQQDAKKALLAKFKPKAAAPDPEFEKLAEKRDMHQMVQVVNHAHDRKDVATFDIDALFQAANWR